MDFSKLSESVIVATSPIEEFDGVDKHDKLSLYELTINRVKALGYPVLVKIHPRESRSDYASLADTTEFVPDKLPLEVFIVLSSRPITILSFFTSAGIGLERYFRMLELCDRRGTKGYDLGKLQEWLQQPEMLEATIKEKLSS